LSLSRSALKNEEERFLKEKTQKDKITKKEEIKDKGSAAAH
jgi:hypothetical protein